jgi:hypothetical protein
MKHEVRVNTILTFSYYRKKHNTLCHKDEVANVLFKEIMAVSSENHTKPRNAHRGRDTELLAVDTVTHGQID